MNIYKYLFWFIFLIFFIPVIFFKQFYEVRKDLEQAYSEGYRVGWSHGIHDRPAQLGNNKNFKFVGIGKECLYEDEDFFNKTNILKIFSGKRCEIQ